MWRIGRTHTFVRTARRYLRRRRHLRQPFARALELLEEDPFHPQLHTHELHGKLRGLHAASVTYQVRLVFQLKHEDRTVMLIDVGDHDSAYR